MEGRGGENYTKGIRGNGVCKYGKERKQEREENLL